MYKNKITQLLKRSQNTFVIIYVYLQKQKKTFSNCYSLAVEVLAKMPNKLCRGHVHSLSSS